MEELLKQILEAQKQIQATLQQHGEVLQQHTEILHRHSETLQQHGEMLQQQSETLQQHGIQLDALQRGQLRLETRLESEVIEKVRALFDGFSLRGDQIETLQKRLDERMDSIETDTRYLVARVVMLEKLAK
jgi:DNA repair exonuclease SbcCD ATPase subunit